MVAPSEEVYNPSPDFQEDVKDPLIDLNLTESTELWLIQWPVNQAPDFDGQEVQLKLHADGQLGSFEGSSGKSYDVVSYSAQHPDATVFLSSGSESKIVGKISRRVSFVRYPEPTELQKQKPDNAKQMYQRYSVTPTQSIRTRKMVSGYSNAASTHSGRLTHSLYETGELSTLKKRKSGEPTRSTDQSGQDSGRGHSSVITSGGLSFDMSQERKSKKKKKIED